jgi:hypothetical protein
LAEICVPKQEFGNEKKKEAERRVCPYAPLTPALSPRKGWRGGLENPNRAWAKRCVPKQELGNEGEKIKRQVKIFG